MTATSSKSHSISVCKSHGLAGQFGHPTGFLGSLVGRLMATKNRSMNQAVVELLDVQPNETVLEIGFGPGTAIQELIKTTKATRIAGVDPSTLMLSQASRRNRRGIQTGQVDLQLRSASQIPFDEETFNKVFAVNSFHHWPDPIGGLNEVLRVLKNKGQLILGLRAALPQKRMFSAPGFTEQQIEEAKQRLQTAGFSEIRRVEREAGRKIVCLISKK